MNRDLQVEHSISLADAFHGAEAAIEYQRLESCAYCNGTGAEPRTKVDPCKQCRGSGHERHRRLVRVTIPAGIESGQSLRVSGQGEVGGRGAQAGDLYVVVNVQADARFERDGADLLTDLPLTITKAALGTEAEIETVDGTVVVTVPAGSKTNRVLRLRGKGMPHLRDRGRGDLHVRLRVVIPTKAELEALLTRVQGLRKRRDDLVRKHSELRAQEIDAALTKIPKTGVTEATRPVADAAERILDAIDADLQGRAVLMARSAEIRKEHRGLSSRLGKGEIGQASFDRAFQALEAEEGDIANDMDQLDAKLFEDKSEKPG